VTIASIVGTACVVAIAPADTAAAAAASAAAGLLSGPPIANRNPLRHETARPPIATAMSAQSTALPTPVASRPEKISVANDKAYASERIATASALSGMVMATALQYEARCDCRFEKSEAVFA
jgi:hypothetical protein